MTTTRSDAEAVRLPNDRVLIIGGYLRGPPEIYLPMQAHPAVYNEMFSSSEIFGPETEAFAVGPDMSERGAAGLTTATLLDNGKVLIVRHNTVELYQPSTGEFTKLGPPAVPRNFHTATKLANGKVLIACGGNGPTAWKSAELYDPDTNLFSLTGEMSEPHFDCSSVLLPDGKVLVAGYADAKDEAEIYDPESGKFTHHDIGPFYPPVPSLLRDGKVLITGMMVGSNTNYILNDTPISAEVFDPTTGVSTAVGAFPQRIGYTATTLADGSVLIAGGENRKEPHFPGNTLLYCP